jgi:hypothetical protein
MKHPELYQTGRVPGMRQRPLWEEEVRRALRRTPCSADYLAQMMGIAADEPELRRELLEVLRDMWRAGEVASAELSGRVVLYLPAGSKA